MDFFHPKIVLQLGRTSGRLMVGSANLTGAGLQSNFETVSVVEATAEDLSAAPLVAAALGYFASHADLSDVAMRELLDRARDWTPWLAGVAPASEVETGSTRLRFVTEDAEGGIAASLVRVLDGDRIGRIVCLSPYWDGTLSAVRWLAEATAASRLHLVVDPDGQDFTAEAFAGLGAAGLHAIDAHPAVAARIRQDGTGRRRLHAKLIVAEGARFDYVLAGSANMTTAALLSSRRHGNAEACLITLEPAGTAIDRLALGPCIAVAFPSEKLRARSFLRSVEADAAPGPRDGGTIVEELGDLFWTPPNDVDPARCRVELLGIEDLGTGRLDLSGVVQLDDDLSGGGEATLLLAAPARRGERWLLEADGWTPGSARFGRVRFDDGGISAPVPVRASTGCEPRRGRRSAGGTNGSCARSSPTPTPTSRPTNCSSGCLPRSCRRRPKGGGRPCRGANPGRPRRLDRCHGRTSPRSRCQSRPRASRYQRSAATSARISTARWLSTTTGTMRWPRARSTRKSADLAPEEAAILSERVAAVPRIPAQPEVPLRATLLGRTGGSRSVSRGMSPTSLGRSLRAGRIRSCAGMRSGCAA